MMALSGHGMAPPQPPGRSLGGSAVAKRRGRTGQRGFRCVACSMSKVKCSRSFPCERCFANCQPCVPPPDARGLPYVDLALSMLDMRSVSEPLIEVILRLAPESRHERETARQILRGWRVMSLKSQRDVTHGAFDVAARAFAFSPVELEEQEELLWDRPTHALKGPSPSLQALTERLATCESFKGLDDGASMLMVTHVEEAGIAVATNGVAGRFFLSSTEANGYLRTHCLLPTYMIASMISPEDRRVWYQTQLLGMLDPPQRSTTFVKFCERNGDIELYILSYRRTRFPELPDGVTGVISLERAPLSKHMTRRPGHRHNVVEAFRQDRSRMSQGSQGLPDGSNPLPGLVCLPLPIIPAAKAKDLLQNAKDVPSLPRKRKASGGALVRPAPAPLAPPPAPERDPPASLSHPSPSPSPTAALTALHGGGRSAAQWYEDNAAPQRVVVPRVEPPVVEFAEGTYSPPSPPPIAAPAPAPPSKPQPSLTGGLHLLAAAAAFPRLIDMQAGHFFDRPAR